MKKIKILILFSLILFGCKTGNKTNSKSIDGGNPKYSTEIEQRIERIINNLQVNTDFEGVIQNKSLHEQMKQYHTPGVSIAVINNGNIEWARGFGSRDLSLYAPVEINTLFQAGSVSKPIFDLALMRLKEKGEIDLDKDVNEYLKSWKVPKNGDWQPHISLRQLLSHTAGLTVHGFGGYLKTDSIPTVTQILDGVHPTNSPKVIVNILPGTTFSYSGGGLTVAQLAIANKLNKQIPKIIDDELFKPLNLKYSTYEQPLPEDLQKFASTGYPSYNEPISGKYHIYPELAAAGLWTNPTELATLVLEVQKSIKGASSLLKKETAEEMLTPQKVAGFIGIGFFLNGKGDSLRFSHGGWNEGFVTQLTAYKNLGKGAIIMVNSNEGQPLLEEIMKAIANEYNWPDYLPSETEYIEISLKDIKEYTGEYYDFNSNKCKIEIIDTELFLSFQNQAPIRIFKTKKGDYKSKILNFSLSFNKNEMLINQQGQTSSYKKK